LIDSIKRAGFTAIRIPVEYNSSHIINIATEQIDPAWLSRVKEVVQYCINDGRYVELNIHWDGGWFDPGATGANLDTVYAKQKALWEQIATTMRDFDEHLMLGSANEPDATDLTSSTNLANLHETFINAVRSTGGKNAYRTLVLQTPSTSIDLADYFLPDGLPGLPNDNATDRLMIEVHYYSPYNFCLLSSDADGLTAWYFWGKNYHSADYPTRNATSNEEDYVDSQFALLKKEFVDKGIPVLVGEYGAFPGGSDLTGDALALHLASRGHYYSYVAHVALANGAMPFIWDTGEIINRTTGAVQNKQLLDSLNYGASH
jgi:aryl-phospho-beta-D-glucosidase BglC (GH1 family)